MKTIYATLFICLMLPFYAVVTSAKLVKLAPAQTAKVEPVQGVFIFYLCTPAQPFGVLGEIKAKQQRSGEPKEQAKTALKSAPEQYPTANGILFTDLNMTKAQAIKLHQPRPLFYTFSYCPPERQNLPGKFCRLI